MMSVANPSLRKGFLEWKKETEEKRRRMVIWRKRVFSWAKMEREREVKGEYNDEEKRADDESGEEEEVTEGEGNEGDAMGVEEEEVRQVDPGQMEEGEDKEVQRGVEEIEGGDDKEDVEGGESRFEGHVDVDEEAEHHDEDNRFEEHVDMNEEEEHNDEDDRFEGHVDMNEEEELHEEDNRFEGHVDMNVEEEHNEEDNRFEGHVDMNEEEEHNDEDDRFEGHVDMNVEEEHNNEDDRFEGHVEVHDEDEFVQWKKETEEKRRRMVIWRKRVFSWAKMEMRDKEVEEYNGEKKQAEDESGEEEEVTENGDNEGDRMGEEEEEVRQGDPGQMEEEEDKEEQRGVEEIEGGDEKEDVEGGESRFEGHVDVDEEEDHVEEEHQEENRFEGHVDVDEEERHEKDKRFEGHVEEEEEEHHDEDNRFEGHVEEEEEERHEKDKRFEGHVDMKEEEEHQDGEDNRFEGQVGMDEEEHHDEDNRSEGHVEEDEEEHQEENRFEGHVDVDEEEHHDEDNRSEGHVEEEEEEHHEENRFEGHVDVDEEEDYGNEEHREGEESRFEGHVDVDEEVEHHDEDQRFEGHIDVDEEEEHHDEDNRFEGHVDMDEEEHHDEDNRFEGHVEEQEEHQEENRFEGHVDVDEEDHNEEAEHHDEDNMFEGHVEEEEEHQEEKRLEGHVDMDGEAEHHDEDNMFEGHVDEEEEEDYEEEEHQEENRFEGHVDVDEEEHREEDNMFEGHVDEEKEELQEENTFEGHVYVDEEAEHHDEDNRFEADYEEEEHQEEEPVASYNQADRSREDMRETDGESSQQVQESRGDKTMNKRVNLPSSVVYDNGDSALVGSINGGYKLEGIQDGERANEKPCTGLEEYADKQSWKKEHSNFGVWTSEEEKVERKLTDGVNTGEEEETFENHHEKIQEEECTDDEEGEWSTEDDSTEDEVKIYSKDDYATVVFSTLTEFRDACLLTDLTLSTADGKCLHVHSPVLAAVSALIRKSLSRRNVENNLRIWDERKDRYASFEGLMWSVSLSPEVDHVGAEAVVEFAYTGLISCLSDVTVHQIKVAAKALDAPRVLDLCTEVEMSSKAAGQKEGEKITAEEQMMISLRSVKQLWIDNLGCDVILEALEGSLHVHRVILAASCDYFRSMFTLGMKESHQFRVTLPFLLASDLEVLLGCSYSGELPLSWKSVFEITSKAMQLQYQFALALSLTFLEQEINPHSCLDVASFAEAYEMTQLLEVADDFVSRQFQKVACTSKFEDLPARQLLKYLKSHSLCVSSELVVFKAVVAWINARPRSRLKLAVELMKTIHFPLMSCKEFQEVKSQNIWSHGTLREFYNETFKEFYSAETAPQSQCRVYLPKESLVLVGGEQTSENMDNCSISRELWFSNSLRNHGGMKNVMEWRRLGEIPAIGRFRHEVVVFKGQLYLFGGNDYYGIYDTLNSVYRYDPLESRWELLAEMHEKRSSFSVVVLDEKIYAIGGYCYPDYIESVEQYCPTSNSWSFTWPLDLPIGCHVARVLQGQIFVSGGLNNDYKCLSSMFLYRPETGSTYLKNMAQPRANHCMEALGECIYVAGGHTLNGDMNVVDQLACEVYNPVTDCWTELTRLSVPHVGAGSAVLEGKFYVLGGYSQEDLRNTKSVHRFDPATQKWENMGKMPGPNNDIRAVQLFLPEHFRL